MRAHSWLAKAPWKPLALFATGAALARILDNKDWLTIGWFGMVNIFFYGYGKFVTDQAWMLRLAKINAEDAKMVSRVAALSLQYQRLHMRHFKMTGENYADNADVLDMLSQEKGYEA